MRRLVLLAVVALVVTPLSVAPSSSADLPSADRWRADVREAMAGSRAYLAERAATAAPGERLAINLDVDNTMLATEYAAGEPVRPVLRLARTARRLGIAVLVNTARDESQRARTARNLAEAGYVIDGLCLRQRGTGAADGKQRCRASFADLGYVLVANVGNHPHDFTGGGYERAYRLPRYGGRLS
ncbi:HAD family acid phosphatase [Nocardioides sp. 1609]|uniref:HAD family acid phosphatase n=1 Tax=Nocardioides sp. 1609 TaxID=2508327 RepID=UPI0010703395|nr:HAD family acid phosphatase [Nocardioides sp. 1609]